MQQLPYIQNQPNQNQTLQQQSSLRQIPLNTQQSQSAYQNLILPQNIQNNNNNQNNLNINNNNLNTLNLLNSNLNLNNQNIDNAEEKKEKNEKINIRTKNVNKYYKVVEEVGKGAYGRVYKAECLKTKKFVALKKFEPNDEKTMQNGFPITALREIKLLKQVKHNNIVNILEIIVTKPSERNKFRGSTFIVMDYMHHDFSGLFKQKQHFSVGQIKNIMKQILQGVHYLHQNKISHRDLKIANILLNNKGVLKIGDFGLSRIMNSHNNNYTVKVVTLWYRAPELLLGMKTYSTQVDIWSVGCILGEFICKENILKGDGEARQIEKIYELCGTPDSNSWPEISKLPYYKEFKPKQLFPNKIEEIVKKQFAALNQVKIKAQENISQLQNQQNQNKKNQTNFENQIKKNQKTLELVEIDFQNATHLLKSLLTLNPNKRLTAEQALKHPFFSSGLPEENIALEQEECHELQINNKRRMLKKQPDQNKILQQHDYKAVPDYIKSKSLNNIDNLNQGKNYNSNQQNMQQQQQQQQQQFQYSNSHQENNNNNASQSKMQEKMNQMLGQLGQIGQPLNQPQQQQYDDDDQEYDPDFEKKDNEQDLEALLSDDDGKNKGQDLQNEEPEIKKQVKM